MSESALKAHPNAKCRACDCRLLVPSDDELCGFCQVELGYRTERDLVSETADLCASMEER